jgi:outer membrane protein
MKKRPYFFSLIAATLVASSAFAAETTGVVNFSSCISDSKLGKQEQSSFESLKKQMSSLLEDTEKQLQELSVKFNDQEYLDGLSPEAEAEMKGKFEALNQDLQRYQNQYYQVMNQANMRIIQNINGAISQAAEKVAKDKKIGMVVNKEACFFYLPALDITVDVIAEMDKIFATQEKAASAENTSDKKAEAKK